MAQFLSSLLAILISLVRSDRNWVEWIVLAAAGLLACVSPDWVLRYSERLGAAFDRLARRRFASLAVIGGLCAGARLLMLPIAPVPVPAITDEFSHLLLANTFALGRLTNPSHPMWRHFETIHVIQQPTYNSMYLPAQATFLAAGKIILGNAWAGVLVSVTLLCMMVCWALRAWLPPRWALMAGLLAVLKFGLFSYWVNSYWGGAVPALGGTLVLGAWGRLERRPNPRVSIVMGSGLLLLAASRPFEGLVLASVVAVAMAWWAAHWNGIDRKRVVLSVAVPAMLVVVCGSAIVLRQQKEVAGRLLPAYAVNQQSYGWPLTLPWFPVKQIEHTHPAMHAYYLWEASEHEKLTAPFRNGFRNALDGVRLWSFFAGPVLTIPLLFLPWSLRDRRIRILVAATGAMLVTLAIEQSRYPHYFAPATAAWLGIAVHSMRHLRAQVRRYPRMLALAALLPIAFVASVFLRGPAGYWLAADGPGTYMSWCCSIPGNLERSDILARLSGTPERHLVIVRYGPKHDPTMEWVYNDPDLEDAKVLWARDMQAAQNEALTRYFSDRKAWILYADEVPARLAAYP